MLHRPFRPHQGCLAEVPRGLPEGPHRTASVAWEWGLGCGVGVCLHFSGWLEKRDARARAEELGCAHEIIDLERYFERCRGGAISGLFLTKLAGTERESRVDLRNWIAKMNTTFLPGVGDHEEDLWQIDAHRVPM